MLKTGKVICPTCGGEVVASDTLDTYMGTSTVTLFMIGECDQCGKLYQWNEEYTLAGYCNLEQTHDQGGNEPNSIP